MKIIPLEDQLELYLRTHQNLDLGDNWEDNFRRELEKRKAKEYLPPLEELIDLNLPPQDLPVTRALLEAKSKEQIQAILIAGIEWATN